MTPTFTDRIKKIMKTDMPSGPQGSHNAKVVAVCNQKGGVGKTTTSINIGAALALKFQKKILLVDMDPQGHVEAGLKSGVYPGSNGSLSGVLLSKKGNIMDIIYPAAVNNLYITTSDNDLGETENQLTSKIGKEFFLRNALTLACTHFDYIIIDCPPNLGNLTLNALMASDFVVIPCEISPLAFEGVIKILMTIDTLNQQLNHNLDVLGILPTRVDSRNITINETVFQQLGENFGDLNFDSRIYVNTDLTKAQDAGKDIFSFNSRSRGAENYQTFAEEFLLRIQ